jgi:hypothetical protein
MRVLEGDRALAPLMEPDNESRSAPAIWGKRRAGRFPVLAPGDSDAEYRWLWSWILDGAPGGGRLELTAPLLRAVRPEGRRRFYRGQASPLMQLAGALGSRPRYRRPGSPHDPRRLLVKTVHLPLAVEWLASEFDVDVVVLLRHPANVLASWISLDLNDQFARLDDRPAIRRRIDEARGIPAPRTDPLARMVWQIAVLNLGLEEAAARNPTWVVRTHEDLCVDPMAKFEVLYRELGLTWNTEAEHYLTSNDRPGEGFPTQRVASDQPDAWKRRLAPGQIETMRSVLSEFSFSTWTQAELAP